MNSNALHAPADLAVEEARELLNRWCCDRFYRVRELGTRIDIDEIVTHGSFSLLLRTQFEHRSVERAAVPYEGGYVDDEGTPPSLWQMDVDPPSVFDDGTEHYVVPHTEEVVTCRPCAGSGSVTCSSCFGRGRVDCTWCHGRGYRERQEHRPGSHGGGWTTVRDSCTCFMGKVTCNWCGGSGSNTCTPCQGHGEMKEYDELVVNFAVEERAAVLDAGGMPGELVRKASGRMLLDLEEKRLTNPPKLTAAINEAVIALLLPSHDYDKEVSRLHFQRLTIEQVPVYEVFYRYRSKSDRLWIYGDERKVHWPNVPLPWIKYLLTALGILALIGGLVSLLVLFVLPALLDETPSTRRNVDPAPIKHDLDQQKEEWEP